MKFSIALVASLFFSVTLAADMYSCTCFTADQDADCCVSVTGKPIDRSKNVCGVPASLKIKYDACCKQTQGDPTCKLGYTA